MASLPDFRSFNQSAVDGEGGISNFEMANQSQPQFVAQDSSRASEAGDGRQASPIAQAGQVETTVDGMADQVNNDDPLATSTTQVPQASVSPIATPCGPGNNVEVISSELASLRAKASHMPFDPENHLETLQKISNLERLQSVLLNSDSSSSLTHEETTSALAHLRAIASTKHFNRQDPENVALLQQISYLEQQLAEFESGSTSKTVLPVVSINITESIIFVMMGIVSFFLNAAMLPVALGVGYIMVFYPKAGDLSLLNATLFTVLAILATAQVYLVRQIPRQAFRFKPLFNLVSYNSTRTNICL